MAKMTKSEADRFARTYRLLASRMYLHMANGKAEKSCAYPEIKAAHDACCKAFTAIEKLNGI